MALTECDSKRLEGALGAVVVVLTAEYIHVKSDSSSLGGGRRLILHRQNINFKRQNYNPGFGTKPKMFREPLYIKDVLMLTFLFCSALFGS